VSRKRNEIQAQECWACGAVLNKVAYTMWGSKKFDSRSGDYVEDDELGSSDIEVSCPSCSAKLDPEGILF